MKYHNWVKFTIVKLQKYLRPSDIMLRRPRQPTKSVAIAYVADELRDANLEDIADLIINLIIQRPEAYPDELDELRDENSWLKERLNESVHNLEAIVKEMKVE